MTATKFVHIECDECRTEYGNVHIRIKPLRDEARYGGWIVGRAGLDYCPECAEKLYPGVALR